MLYLLHIHGYNIYSNAPHWYICAYTACIVYKETRVVFVLRVCCIPNGVFRLYVVPFIVLFC